MTPIEVTAEAEPQKKLGRPRGARTRNYGSYALLRKDYLATRKRFFELRKKMLVAKKAHETLQKALTR